MDLAAREKNITSRENKVAVREINVTTREKNIEMREKNIEMREINVTTREKNIAMREKKIEIIAYCSKTIPDTMLHAGILTQELVAILFALKSLNRFLSSADVTLLTDSKCLYYLFNGQFKN